MFLSGGSKEMEEGMMWYIPPLETASVPMLQRLRMTLWKRDSVSYAIAIADTLLFHTNKTARSVNNNTCRIYLLLIMGIEEGDGFGGEYAEYVCMLCG